MSNFFAGIYRANDALTAARYGLEVTGQNIANANTPGYTRQVSRQSAVGTAVGVSTIHSGTVTNGGVRATGADRLNDAILDIRARDEHAKSAGVTTNAARLSDIENIFKEPSDNGLSEQLHDFWNAWGDVANAPDAAVPRQMLITSAQSTATMLHSMNSALDSVATAAANSLQAQVTAANTAASDLADLNRKIAIGNATGVNVNALLDQRDLLLDKLSTTVGGVATLADNGTATVTVGGQTLVNGGAAPFAAGSLSAPLAGSNPPTGASVSITPPGGTSTVLVDPVGPPPKNDLGDSTLKAEVHAVNDTVPKYRGMLDGVAQSLADAVNGLQGGGFDLSGNAGVAMFTNGSGGTSAVTAANITVALDPSADWKKVAAADTQSHADPNDPTSPVVGNVNGSNALKAASMGSDPSSPDNAYSSLVGELGRASASAQQQQSTQSVITSSVDTLRSTVSGVSYDEEVSNMLTYQMAFQASSRVLTTLDSMLDTLINHTGLVGQS